MEGENQEGVYDSKFASKTQSIVNYSKYWLRYEPEEHKIKLETALKFIQGELGLLNKRIT